MNHRGELECTECYGQAYFYWNWVDGDEQGERCYLNEAPCWHCKGSGILTLEGHEAAD